jgi:hydrogenase maturation protein HypF
MLNTGQEVARWRLRVQGVVQGVGFRPFVYNLAVRHGLAGFVGNDDAGVFVEVEGPEANLSAFHTALTAETPPLAHIQSVTVTSWPATGAQGFAIVPSEDRSSATTLVSPDLCICEDCLRELFDPADRRYRYPFINCTNCGPRFTIIRDLPYDRPRTTMADFVMCPACAAEYADPRNRRFHAQPNACPVCGPQVEFRWGGLAAARFADLGSVETVETDAARVFGEPAIQQAQRVLATGGIVAVKGIGGFHLACDAANDGALARLRERKGRVDKPFALMAASLAVAEALVEIDAAERALLTSRARPVVLLRKRAAASVSPLAAPGNPALGVMLPYSPLHFLLLNPLPPLQAPSVLVMTSGNYSDEPIVADNEEALARLAGLADAFLLHNRAIHSRCDDSVVRIFSGVELPIRRSRGYAPFPVTLPVEVPPTLAVGGELKATFCLAAGRHAFMSQHIGDMENLETLAAFERAVDQFQRLFRIAPEIIAADLHPGYLSTRWAAERAGKRRLVQVQHHHAHIAAVMAEHGLDGSEPVIGFSFDGTGYGPDGAIWGGEVFVADYHDFVRAAHLDYTPLPGGDAAVKRPYRVALAQLWTAGVEWDAALPPVAACPATERSVLRRQLETGLNTAPTSSMGRLFDAVAALAGLRQIVTYEAQAAIELEGLVEPLAAATESDERYRFIWHGDEVRRFDAAPVLRAVVEDVLRGTSAAIVATRFHGAVSALIVEAACDLRREHGLSTVALSGGVFQNVTLLGMASAGLTAQGFRVLSHRLVPPNDGGLALGQAMVAGTLPDKRRKGAKARRNTGEGARKL